MVRGDPESPSEGRPKDRLEEQPRGRPKDRPEGRLKDRRRIDTGKGGETIAAAYLERMGYVVLERNYRCVFGEIDIVARDGAAICFVEVKSRRSARYGDPQLAVTRRKQEKMIRTAQHYLAGRGLEDRPARFDVAAIRLSPDGAGTVELIRNAFELKP
ncbi:MAG: YraN family protein [Syntrophales bacterium]|jgi:putative endonuclease